MSIVIEGLDATGKSTLARYIAEHIYLRDSHDGPEYQFNVVESEGPPKSKGEFLYRIERYLDLPDNTIFVRHPIVSNPIYDHARRHSGRPIILIPSSYIQHFYSSKPLFIYCASTPRDHQIKEHDTPEHIAMIKLQAQVIEQGYIRWALDHAHIVYRIGDSMDSICGMIEGFYNALD